ncbi:outer membrane protein assembly factor BamE [Aestuariivirga litoralis]|uniref:outer membrane protein assembly factor BamE n=1 Tax=Aestuariivirga litoralis TaxID=2650924 RepID=UPI0018C5901F|nr:outer membrane protein assembly factor BamE [Aestuariivirga litoralis]
MWLVTAVVASALAGCTPEIDHRGYLPKPGVFNQIHAGMSKVEVEGNLGSPTTTASVNFAGDSYYYISSTTQQTAFFKPVETDRLVIAVRFDRQDRVSGVAQYGLQDGHVIDMNTRKSPVTGSEFSLLVELFKGVGDSTPTPGASAMKPTR